MAQYEVAFYKTLLSPYGMPWRCLQGEITVAEASTPDDAVVSAEREFERSRKIPNWTLCADFFEVRPALKAEWDRQKAAQAPMAK
jgi:hypothetical protein